MPFNAWPTKRLPQSPCFGPILWVLIANFITKEISKHGFLIYAFANDFCLILSCFRRLDLEMEAAAALPALMQILESLGVFSFQINLQALIFTEPHDLRKRYHTIKINGKSVKLVPSLQLFGIIIDRYLNCFSLINYRQLNILNCFKTSYILSLKYWGIKSTI